MRWVWAGCLLGLTLHSWAALPLWQPVRQADGSLAEVTVAGRADTGRQRAPASLALACRPGAATLALRLPEPALGFDLAPFEGPDGAGQRAQLARLYLGRERGQPVALSGWRGEAQPFQFSLQLPPASVPRLFKAKELTLRIRAAGGKRGQLQLQFALPPDTRPLRKVLANCGF